MSVTLCTHCHSRDLPRLHAPKVLEDLIACHDYPFSEILVAHQRCEGLYYELPDDQRIRVLDIPKDDYEPTLKQFGIPHNDPALSEITHGWNWQWYYEHHCVNHCREILEASSDYIVFNDADCRITQQPSSWVKRGIEILESNPKVFVVSPSDGGKEYNEIWQDGTRLTQTMSQQLFMGRTAQMKQLNFTHLQWDGKFDAPYGPMQEFYGLMEGWLWRYMRANGFYRAVLPEQYRYWHLAYH